jgi:hypothetical protein
MSSRAQRWYSYYVPAADAVLLVDMEDVEVFPAQGRLLEPQRYQIAHETEVVSRRLVAREGVPIINVPARGRDGIDFLRAFSPTTNGQLPDVFGSSWCHRSAIMRPRVHGSRPPLTDST